MKFTKSTIKRKLKECRSSNTILRSMYGVIPHIDFLYEKVTGTLSFVSEPNTKRVLTDNNLRNVGELNTQLSRYLRQHFDVVLGDDNSDEHCIVLAVSKESHDVAYMVIEDNNELSGFISSIEQYILVVIVHFLPTVAAKHYAECSKSNYSISFSNKLSFDGYKFSASLRLKESEFPNTFHKETNDRHKQDVADIEMNLKKRFNEVQHITSHNDKVIVGFSFKFNEMNRINILKLINIKKSYTINVVSSLNGIGLGHNLDKNGSMS